MLGKVAFLPHSIERIAAWTTTKRQATAPVKQFLLNSLRWVEDGVRCKLVEKDKQIIKWHQGVQLGLPCMFEAKADHQFVSHLRNCRKFPSMEH